MESVSQYKLWVNEDWTIIPPDSVQSYRNGNLYIGYNVAISSNFKDSLNGLLFCKGVGGPQVFRTTNGGSFWEEIFHDRKVWHNDSLIWPALGLQAVAVNGEQVIMTTYYDGSPNIRDTSYIFRSSNYGLSWDTIRTNASYGSMDIKMLDAEYGAILSWDEIVITQDSGKTWSKTPKFDDMIFYPFQLFVPAKGVFYMGALHEDFKHLYYTYDSGISWDIIDLSDRYQVRNFNFIEPGVGFVAGIDTICDGCYNNMYIDYTNDNGKTWYRKLDTSLSDNRTSQYSIINLPFLDKRNGFLLGYDGNIFRTSDGGNHWEYIGVPTDRPNSTDYHYAILKNVSRITDNKLLANSAVFHRILYIVPLLTPLSIQETQTFETTFFKVYPNPVIGDKLNIDFNEMYGSNYDVEIVDVCGRVMKTFKSIPIINGNRHIAVSIGDLSSGFYILRVFSSNSRKFVGSSTIIKSSD
jgi:photosystem II stability/assembly factor-like uncharacterized protein